jgi:inosine-uridine nucleoside N-ribohydrolase
MARAIEEHPGRLTLVAIGPSTNIALLMLRRPDLVPRIKAIALMGGETALRRGEHNVVSDDLAAQHVLSCGRTAFLGTWSVTRQVVILPPEVERLRTSGSRACKLLAEMHDLWHPAQSWKPGPVMYDLAPILWVFRPDLFQTERQCIAVDLTGTHTRGWTVPVQGTATVDVTTGVDAAAAHKLLMDTLLSLE